MVEEGEDEDWIEFSKWFEEDSKKRFHDAQYSDKEIAYAAWLEGIRRTRETYRSTTADST